MANGSTFTAPNLAPAMTAAVSLSNLVLAIPQTINQYRQGPQYTQGYQPQNQPQPTGLLATLGSLLQPQPGFLFHYEGENKVTVKSDITDHYIEDNTAIQDQCALHPEIISVTGFIGELNDIAPPGLAQLQSLATRLTAIAGYSPQLTTTALLAYNEAFQAYQIAANVFNSGAAAWSSIAGNGGEGIIGTNGLQGVANQNKQQTAFQKFYGWWRNRTFFTIQTPWAVFQNVLIEEMVATQTEETTMISDFKVTFKLIRTVQSVFAVIPNVQQGQLATQATQNNPTNNLVTAQPSIPFSSLGTNFSLPGAP